MFNDSVEVAASEFLYEILLESLNNFVDIFSRFDIDRI